MASVGTLAAGVAHEINNPLAYVSGNLTYVAEELARLLTEARGAHRTAQVEVLRAVSEALDEAQHGAGRVRDIVKDLKTFSRDDEAEAGPLDLRPVLESSLSMCNNEIKHRARLRKEWGEVPRVHATEAKLGQVFLNLLVNAAQALKDGAADQHEIVVRTFTDAQGRAVVEVRDSGCGIPPENLKRIFDPFFTTKPVGVGTGLGLSICHNIVTALGGTISVESELEKGTCFRVVLPPASAQPEVAAPVMAPVGASRVVGARILVLDDDPLLSKSLVRLFGREARTEALADPREALARVVAGERFDVILCDVMMPRMSGQEFWEALGRVAPEQRERLVFVTGGAFTAEAQSFLQTVSNPVCPKPFDLDALHSFVRERMREARP
jgi:CheY-like chemotaxis protein